MADASGAPSARRLGQSDGCVPPCLVGRTGRIYCRPLRDVWTHGRCSATSVCNHGRCGARRHPSHPPVSADVDAALSEVCRITELCSKIEQRKTDLPFE